MSKANHCRNSSCECYQRHFSKTATSGRRRRGFLQQHSPFNVRAEIDDK